MFPTLEKLPPISLEELVQEAALLTRIDRKYVLDLHSAIEILAIIDPTTRILTIDGEKTQPYASTYFDTPDLRSFYLAAHKRRRKFKIRTRSYQASHQAFLEVKATGARGTTIKSRTPYCFQAATQSESLSPEVLPWLSEQLERAGQAPELPAQLRPVLWGSYQRSTVLMADGSGRATIDTELRWNTAKARLHEPEMVIIETKSGARPAEIDKLLWQHGHRPARISKYATGMAALDHQLPHNRWSRTLQRHFHSQPVLQS